MGSASQVGALLNTRRVDAMHRLNMPAMPTPEIPFGGIKDSGYGSEGGPEPVAAYLSPRTVVTMNV